jgi:hypothetical protein
MLADRMIAAARLDVDLYEEVEADTGATTQAMTVVVLVALASGIGALGGGGGPLGLLVGIIAGLASWAIWAFITFVIGTTLLSTPETEANWGQMARTTGFAQSPGIFRVFGFIPGLGPVIVFAALLWQLSAMVVAVRQALDYKSTWRALGVVIIGFIILVIIQSIVLLLFVS